MQRLCRQKVLDIVRGAHRPTRNALLEGTPTRIFPLERQHLASLHPNHKHQMNPDDFHSLLCRKIKKASRRIYLASLYVGPACDPQVHRQEARLLQALERVTRHNHTLDVKILLDKSRGLRPVPIQGSNATITSAEACRRALSTLSNHPSGSKSTASSSVYLHSVLSSFIQTLLPNPLDEVAGVFHIKAYVMDDDLVLTGANLSEEYFLDRHDRYLHILDGGNGIVDWYAQLIQILCDHSEEYRGENKALGKGKPRKDLVHAVRSHFHDPESSLDTGDLRNALNDADMGQDTSSIVAWACPTFQFPQMYRANYRSDSQVFEDLLTATNDDQRATPSILRVASAYLNPSTNLQKAWQSLSSILCLTAGFESHGFRPKKKAGNKGRTWIPAVFDKLARKLNTLDKVSVYYFTRKDWTFHAKGLWFSSCGKGECSSISTRSPRFGETEDLVCVSHGSGNYGERSECRDMESNLYLILPVGSPLIRLYKEEWNSMCDFAVATQTSPEQALPWHIHFIFPFIKGLF